MSAARQKAAPHQKPQSARPRAANDNPRLRRSALVTPGHDYLFPDQVQARNVGRCNDLDRWLERCERSDQLMHQTRCIANALEREGIRSREAGDQVADYDHVLGTWHEVERFRPIRFLPVVMQRDSAAMLSSLRYFMHNHTLGRYVRMATITGGQRVPAFGPLRERQQAISRSVSKWAHECESWGVSVVFRSNEHTREPGQGEGDPATYHPHGHVLFTPRLRMDDERWAAFLKWSGKYFRKRMPGTLYGFHDCGRIEEPDEACKYTFKPGDLATASDAELAWLYRETYRTNQKQPMREFKDFRQQLESNRRDTGAEEIKRDVDVITGEVLSETRSVVNVRAPLKVVSVWPAENAQDPTTPRLEIVHKRRRPSKDDRDQERDENGNRRPPRLRENYILFTGNPTATFCPYATVRSRVMGYTEHPTTREGLDGLADLKCISAQVQNYWNKRDCPPPHRIPLELELHAATLDRQYAETGEPAFRHQAKLARMRADRLREALGPVAAQGPAEAQPTAEPYKVHTCSLTVQETSLDGSATGCLAAVETAPKPPDPPPRSDYEAQSTPQTDTPKAPHAGRAPHVWRYHLDAIDLAAEAMDIDERDYYVY